MTDQLKTAMADYPDELRVVMERAGWVWRSWSWGDSEWEMDDKSGEMLCLYASENDAIVACMEWLMDEAAMYMYTGDWRDVQCFKNRYGLLIALLIAVRDARA